MKSQRTIDMSLLVKSLFSQFRDPETGYYCDLNSEVPCGINGKKRCDVAGYEYHNSKRHNSIGIELKQHMNDFKTGCGQNYTFDINYLCVPSELVGYALRYMESNCPDWVGLIEYCDSPQYKYPDLLLVKAPTYNHSRCLEETVDCIKEWDRISLAYLFQHSGSEKYLRKVF